MEDKDQVLAETLEVSSEPAEQPEQEITQDAEQKAAPMKDNSSERNFKAMREIKERTERERDEALRRLQEYEQRSNTQAQPQQVSEDDDDISLGPDELAEGKHLSKVGKKIKKLEQQIHNYQQQSQTVAIESRLKSEYPDFDKIVSKTNIDLLKEMHPHIANTLNSASDLYSKAVSAYTLIKSLGIHVEDTFQQDRQLAQKNASKPRPLTSVSPQQGDSPISRANAFANGLTEDLKVQLRKEMEEARRGY